ncbi:unnamed protein product [Brassica oleracea]
MFYRNNLRINFLTRNFFFIKTKMRFNLLIGGKSKIYNSW